MNIKTTFSKSRIAVLAVAAIAAFGSSVANAMPNLVVNGGFDSTTSGPGFIGQSTNLNNWTYTNGFAAVVAAGTANTTGITLGSDVYYLWGPGANGGNVANGLTASSPTGGNFLSSDADPATAVKISQTLSGLTVGSTYTLTFDFAAAQYRSVVLGQFGNGPSNSAWNVSFGTDVFATNVLSIGTHGFSGWQGATFTHVATSATEVLSFLASGGPAGVPPAALLDGISVTQQPANVPEPATGLLIGLAAVVGAISRKKKQA